MLASMFLLTAVEVRVAQWLSGECVLATFDHSLLAEWLPFNNLTQVLGSICFYVRKLFDYKYISYKQYFIPKTN